jgi:hypothetical protein
MKNLRKKAIMGQIVAEHFPLLDYAFCRYSKSCPDSGLQFHMDLSDRLYQKFREGRSVNECSREHSLLKMTEKKVPEEVQQLIMSILQKYMNVFAGRIDEKHASHNPWLHTERRIREERDNELRELLRQSEAEGEHTAHLNERRKQAHAKRHRKCAKAFLKRYYSPKERHKILTFSI